MKHIYIILCTMSAAICAIDVWIDSKWALAWLSTSIVYAVLHIDMRLNEIKEEIKK